MSRVELTKGRARLSGFLWVPMRQVNGSTAIGTEDLFNSIDELVECAGLEDHAPEQEPDGCFYFPGAGTAIPIDIVLLEARLPSQREHPYVPTVTRVRMYRDAAMAHLDEVDTILEAGTDQLANMTWANLIEYVARAELLTPTSPVRRAVTQPG